MCFADCHPSSQSPALVARGRISSPIQSTLLWFFTVPCLPIILNIAFAGIGYPGIGTLLLFLALALFVGFVEETYFRGMMLRALLKRGPWQAVIISSLFFGILHLLNVAAGANLAATLLQVVYAVAFGLMYAALALRTQTILPLIVIHGLTDFFGLPRLEFNGCHHWPEHTCVRDHGRRDHHLHCVQYYPDASGESAGVRGRDGDNVHATIRT